MNKLWPWTTESLLVIVTLYSISITMRYAKSENPVNPLCLRDFVEPTASGTCLCGEKKYCLCTPSLASDIIIELEDDTGTPTHIVFIERGDGRGLAMVGGFVKVGESAEAAAAREALEETGLSVTSLRQWCLFSKPKRDPRRHTAALVFAARARGTPRAADDAKGIRTVAIKELQTAMPKFAFDHGDIVGAYVARHHPLGGGGVHGGRKGRRNRSLSLEEDASGGGSRYDGACVPF